MAVKVISLVFVFLFSFVLVSAVTIYSGESTTFELDKPYEYYSIVGNESVVDIDVVQNGNNVTITPNIYSQEDSYEIIFFDKEKETITVYQSSGGGSSRTRYKTEYKNITTTKYIDREVEVPGDTIEVPGETIETTISKNSKWLVGIIGILIIILAYVLSRPKETEIQKSDYTTERRLEDYE